MRKKLTKIAALVLAATMVFGLTACGGDSKGGKGGKGANAYTVVKDKNGKTVDLGGITITIRDWWSDPEGNLPEARDEYEEARAEYRDWLQKTYNFTMKVQGIGDWGSVPQDFVDYVQNGGDDNNYCFVLRWSSPVLQAMYSGMCYDLATLDCLDFSENKYQINQAHEKGKIGDHIYAFAGGYVEPKGGIYFNKKVLQDAGIEPDQIYDWQKNGEWTWDKWDEVCAKVHRDTDGDGVVDVYGVTANEGEMFQFFLASNGGALVKKDSNGKFVYALEDADTMEAFEWIVNFWSKYDNHDPEGAQWDYFKEEFLSGNVAFLPEQEYAGCGTNYLSEAQFDCGFVMYPKGPKAQNYASVFDDNPYMIPGCYDADKAWKIAFAVDQWFNQPAGYEDFNARLSDARNGIFDERAVTETIAYMTDPKNATILYSSIIPTLCDNAMADLGWPGWYTVPSTAAETVRDTWKAYIADANK